MDYPISTTRVAQADTACRPMPARRSGHSGRRPIAATHQIDLASNQPIDLMDITDRVDSVVGRLGPWAGTATIFSRHTTAAVRIQEDEPLLLDDLRAFLLRLAPPEARYAHNDFDVRTEHMHPDERPNGHAHCLHLLLGASTSVPVADGALHLGTWQRIFFVDLDGPRSDRAVQVQLTGLSDGWSGAPWR